MARRRLSGLAAAGLALALAGCVAGGSSYSGREPAARVAGVPSPALNLPSAESLRLAAYYASVEKGLLAQGLLRTDQGGRDAPFSTEQLAENFVRTALFHEYSSVGGQMSARQAAASLKRWDRPIRYDVAFDGAIPSAQEARDRRSVDTFAKRLARVTGHPMTPAYGRGNFHVLFLDEEARRGIAPRLRRLIPEIGEATLNTVVNLRKSFYCVALAADPQNDGSYDSVVIVIRAELPDLMRLMCIHEEMAQGLGLSNDSQTARPSIFNDDSEYALLTRHDELLLKMLYDPRLRPGMTGKEARPMIRHLAAEYMPEAG